MEYGKGYMPSPTLNFGVRSSIWIMGIASLVMMLLVMRLITEVSNRSETLHFVNQKIEQLTGEALLRVNLVDKSETPSPEKEEGGISDADRIAGLENVADRLSIISLRGETDPDAGLGVIAEAALCLVHPATQPGTCRLSYLIDQRNEAMKQAESEQLERLTEEYEKRSSRIEGKLADARAEGNTKLIETLRNQLDQLDEEFAERTGSAWMPVLNEQSALSEIVTNPLAEIAEMVRQQSSETLIAWAVIFSGSIGAIAGALYRGSVQNAVPVITGLFAGFIVYLVLKGGRFLLLSESGLPGETFANPYSMVLVGVMAGLFIDQMFQRLQYIVDTALAREREQKAENARKHPAAAGS